MKKLLVMCSAAVLTCGDCVFAMEAEYPEPILKEETVHRSNGDTRQDAAQKLQKDERIPRRKNKVFAHSHPDNRYTELQASEYKGEQLNVKSSDSKLLHYKAFPNLKKLTILDHDLEYIKESSPKFPKLEEIEVAGMINGENFSSLITLLSKAPNLKTLNLKFVQITADNFADLMNSTADVKNYKIKGLKLSGFIGENEEKITLLSEFFIYVSGLEILDLSGVGLKRLPDTIEFLTNLRQLDVCGNKLTVLQEEIGNLHNLRVLNLSGTKLTKLPESIGNLTSLEELYLSSNMGDLPNSIINLKNLRIFDAAGCDNAKFWTAKLQTLKSANKNLEIILE